ncbi:hypothetical protein Q8A67_018892 [Cirrhinus molitorella]|uniref:Uncharacterized protein n=1 Tax=Cirrhinus molitorella TaxID=172907 RepID=A0AA88TJF1_9TELE|nr:hypothetical protein Q8A67_018892 [Cirrhinus molitorella]
MADCLSCLSQTSENISLPEDPQMSLYLLGLSCASRLKNIVSQFPTYLVSSQLQTTLSQGLTGAAKVPFPDFLSHSIRVFIYKSSKFLFKLDAVRAIYPPSIYSRASSRDLLMKHFPQQEKGQTRPLEVQRDAVIMGSVQESPAPAASTRSFPFMCGLAPC